MHKKATKKKKSLRRPQEEKERKGPTINYKVINKYTSYINVVLLLSNNLKEQKFPRKKKNLKNINYIICFKVI